MTQELDSLTILQENSSFNRTFDVRYENTVLFVSTRL